MTEPIQVWRFHEAPAKYKVLSAHGGDEDWLALVPVHLANAWIGWLEGGPFGVCDISQHRLEDGCVVYIGAHA